MRVYYRVRFEVIILSKWYQSANHGLKSGFVLRMRLGQIMSRYENCVFRSTLKLIHKPGFSHTLLWINPSPARYTHNIRARLITQWYQAIGRHLTCLPLHIINIKGFFIYLTLKPHFWGVSELNLYVRYVSFVDNIPPWYNIHIMAAGLFPDVISYPEPVSWNHSAPHPLAKNNACYRQNITSWHLLSSTIDFSTNVIMERDGDSFCSCNIIAYVQCFFF